MLITIVDDDLSVRKALGRLLRSRGFEVEDYGSAQEFFERDYQRIDCIILDIHLGRTTGFELQREMINQGFDPPVIFMTAHDDEETRQHAIATGAIAYLSKPFRDEALVEAIKKATKN